MKTRNPILTATAVLTLLFLYAPSLAAALFSFNQAKYGLAWKGFSWRWYERLFHNQAVWEAALNSLLTAAVSTLAATILGTALALGLERFPWPPRLRAFMDFILHLPVVAPDIVLAAALALAFNFLNAMTGFFEMGLVTLIVGHISFQISFVALVVGSRLTSLGRDLDEAARDLYASGFFLFLRVTWPLIRPGVLAGAMLAFTLSLDDFIVSFFTHGPDSVTLPIYIYSAARRGLSPEIHALSTLILVFTVILVFLAGRLGRRATTANSY